MSNLNLLYAAGNDLALVCGSFAPNMASAPLVSSFTNAAQFSSITHPGTGQFLIKFTFSYPQLVSSWATIGLNAVADLKAQFGAYTPAAAGAPAQIILNILAVATPTDIAANANNRIFLGFIFRQTTWQQ